MPKKGTKKCGSCHEYVPEDDIVTTHPEYGPVCETCYYEAQRIATVVIEGEIPKGFEDPDIDEDGKAVFYVTEFSNPTPFVINYRRTDGWRGYYYPETPKGWIKLRNDAILVHSEDELELKKFDTELASYLEAKGLALARVFTITSNVFCAGYDVFVEVPDDDLEVFEILAHVQKLVERYRDDGRFARTCYTGSGEKTREADIIVSYAKHLQEPGPHKGPQEYLEDVKDGKVLV